MARKDAIAWVVVVCANSLRLSQTKTLSILVAATLSVERISYANIGRAILAGRVKHQIKRCFRFCANDRIETADAMRGIVARILKKRKKKLLISLDWTDIKGFQTLMASAVFKGRSIPLCWSSCNKHVYDGHRSRNSFEESLLLVLRSMIPSSIEVVILADRGFGRTELARFCQRHHFSYVIHIQLRVIIHSPSHDGTLLDYPVYKGICKLLKAVAYRDRNSVEQNIIIRWVHDLPKKRDECWFLMTDLIAGPAQISRLYRQYCWPVHGVSDLKIAPFHLLASEGKVHVDRDHAWHMQTLGKLAEVAPNTPMLATTHKIIDVTNPAEVEAGIAWWEQLASRGGEGMVVKPLDFIVRGKKGLVQPAVKCRGSEYLRIIYGPEYDAPGNLERLRHRGLAAKRSLAIREFALGIEALERLVRREPLRRVHECVFGVLALESEPVDPRL